jgi:hypothetical protein
MIVDAADGQYITPPTIGANKLVHGSRYNILINLTTALPSDYTLRACSSDANQISCGYAKLSYRNGNPLPLSPPAEAYITYGASNTSSTVRFLNNASCPLSRPRSPPPKSMPCTFSVSAAHLTARPGDGASPAQSSRTSLPSARKMDPGSILCLCRSQFRRTILSTSTVIRCFSPEWARASGIGRRLMRRQRRIRIFSIWSFRVRLIRFILVGHL